MFRDKTFAAEIMNLNNNQNAVALAADDASSALKRDGCC
jgi:hypothetical protein